MFRWLVVLLLLSHLGYGLDNNVEVICVGEYKNKQCTQTLSMDNNSSHLDKQIFTIQQKIRERVNHASKKNKNVSIVLYAQKDLAVLTAIAQGNLNRYYRDSIKGMILVDMLGNIHQICKKSTNSTGHTLCKNIQTLQSNIKKKASLFELEKSLSPSLQVDWYWPKTLLLAKEIEAESSLIQSLETNGIDVHSEIYSEDTIDKFLQTIDTVTSAKHTKPKDFGPVLRFHLHKMLYVAKNKITKIPDISYGENKQQRYDIYHIKNRTNVPVMIYLHGGGWVRGDKSAYEGVCKRYVDKGYLCIALNYRLMDRNTSMQTILNDVTHGIDKAIEKSKAYGANINKIVLLAESAGGQIAFMATRRLSTKIKAMVLNSFVSDFNLYPVIKQHKLSNTKDKNKQKIWNDKFSPLKHLKEQSIPILALHGLSDTIVIPKHLERVDIENIIYHKNIKALWVANATHPIVPASSSMQPSYIDIEEKIKDYLSRFK